MPNWASLTEAMLTNGTSVLVVGMHILGTLRADFKRRRCKEWNRN
jgi:hypothetical protein